MKFGLHLSDRAKYAVLLVWCAAGVWTLALDDPRLRYMSYLVAQLGMGVSWVVLSRGHASQRLIQWTVGAAIALRIAALCAAPAFSEDVFRYVFEGRVVWDQGLGFPFRHPPADAPALGVDPRLLDAAWLRINHPHLSTIYPPASQIVFVTAAKLGTVILGPLTSLKTLLLAAEVGAALIVARTLSGAARSRAIMIWALCPLAIWEIARDGHADSISMLGLAMGAAYFLAHRPTIGFLGWAFAALAKLNGLLVLPFALRVSRRGVWVLFLTLPWLLLPYLLAGTDGLAGLSTYAQKWRSGDGIFSMTLALSRTLLGGDWHTFGPSLTLTAHQLARIFTAGGLLVAMAMLMRRLDRIEDVPGRAASFLLILLLSAPTLHPWYVLWLLPFVVSVDFTGRRAALLLAVLAPLLHHPGWMELNTGLWKDVGWVRALVHVPVWALLAADLVQKRELSYPANAEGE